MLVAEYKKRKRNVFLQGKRLYFETARRKKSKQHIVLSASHLFITFASNIAFNVARNYHAHSYATDNSVSTAASAGYFAFVLTTVIFSSLSGFFNVIVYLSLKKPHVEDDSSELLAKYSMRKSIRSVDNITDVTGGYKPKTSCSFNSCTIISNPSASLCANTNDFGIFMGGEDDDEDDNGDEDDIESNTSVSFRWPLHDMMEFNNSSRSPLTSESSNTWLQGEFWSAMDNEGGVDVIFEEGIHGDEWCLRMRHDFFHIFAAALFLILFHLYPCYDMQYF